MDQAKSDRERLAEIELIYSGPTTGAAHDVERIKWLLPFARLAIEAAAHEPKPAESEVEAAARRWHVSAQNDGLFIIDAPPRPSKDEQFHDRQDGPRMAIPVSPLCEHRVIEIVNAHNRALDAYRRACGEDVEALNVALANAEAERVRLRFAILAGEDVPGFAETVSTAECTELLAEERRLHRARSEKADTERDALRKQVETLREALAPFKTALDLEGDTSEYSDNCPLMHEDVTDNLTYGHLRKARAALAATEEPSDVE